MPPTRRTKTPELRALDARWVTRVRLELSHSRGDLRRALLVVSLSALAAACDGGAPVIDAATPVESRASQIELRIDVVPDKPASLTVLGYRAVFSGVTPREVLGLVDPLAGAGLNRPPGECQLRDLDRASADLAAHGDAIELQELKGVSVASVNGGASELLRLSPRMFPDIAASIGGVVAEGGPVGLPQFPQRLQVSQASQPAAPAPTDLGLELPAPAWLRQINGAPSLAGTAINVASGLRLTLSASGRDDTAIELRPFGATVALSCSVPIGAGAINVGANAANVANLGSGEAQFEFAVSRQALAGLVAAAGGAPGAPIAAALDVVRRTERSMSPAPSSSSSSTEVALEIRTSTLVELRP